VSLHIGGYDQWLVAVDLDGEVLWEKSLGGSLDDGANDILSVGTGLLMAGYTWSNDGHVTENFGTKDLWVVKLEWFEGIEEPMTAMAHVFPNPVKNGYLAIHSINPCVLELISVSGKIVYSCEIQDMEKSVQLRGLNSGLYFARFIGTAGIQIEKILIE